MPDPTPNTEAAPTYWIDAAKCQSGPEWDPTVGCDIERITDEYGQDTPHLICQTHGEVVGHVV